jgi:hypothetical protein
MAGVPFIEEDVRLFTAPTLGRPALVLKFGGKSLHSFVRLLQLLFIKLCEPSNVVGSTERTRSPPAAVDQRLGRGSRRAISAMLEQPALGLLERNLWIDEGDELRIGRLRLASAVLPRFVVLARGIRP